MLLRICLIIALVGGLAAAVVNFVKVKEVITTTIAERDSEKAAKETAQADAKNTHKKLDDTTKTLAATTAELKQTKSALETANNTVDELQKAKTDLTARLEETKAVRDKFDQELSRWKLLNLTPEQVTQMTADLKNTTAERNALLAENKILNKKNAELTNELATLRGGPESIPALPVGLKGKIVAVDSKYAFVVLDIGEDSGVLPRGVMFVARDGKFVGKVQIARVESKQSVANLMPAWTPGPLMEGDQVLY